jgi:hypothetical protein
VEKERGEESQVKWQAGQGAGSGREFDWGWGGVAQSSEGELVKSVTDWASASAMLILAVGSGQWAVGSGQWALGTGHWALGRVGRAGAAGAFK